VNVRICLNRGREGRGFRLGWCGRGGLALLNVLQFTGGTKVLLASGAAIPIAALKPGDMVLATNVKTRKTQAETVAAVLVHHDTDLTT